MLSEQRYSLVQQLQRIRRSRVLVYVTGDRFPTQAQIGEGAVRPFIEHVRSLGHVRKLDLFIYSRGGALDVPWRLASALRQASDEWNILVPFRANSAATLLALGADTIVMGPQGELGPIDPSLTLGNPLVNPAQGTGFQMTVSIEDVMAYLRFAERAGLTDQAALTVAFSKLADRIDPVILGNIHRTHSHIRDVARRMILSRSKPTVEQQTATIIETLAEKVYAHGHALGFKEAKAAGLPVQQATKREDEVMWALLGEYESELKLDEPLDVFQVLDISDPYTEETVMAFIESDIGCHTYGGKIWVEGQRNIPPTLNVSLNLQLAIPAGMDPSELPAQLQQQVAALQAALAGEAQMALQEAIRQQAPLVGAQLRVLGQRWRLDRRAAE